MTLPTNDNISNRELPIEELEVIAAGLLVAGASGFGHPPPPPRPRPGWYFPGALVVSADLKLT